MTFTVQSSVSITCHLSNPVAVTCPPLNSISNGSIAYSPDSPQRFTFDTVAAHSCNEGYYLVGRGIRTCVGDGSTILGQWSGVPPMCTGNDDIRTICALTLSITNIARN